MMYAKHFIWVLPSSPGTVFCFYAFTSTNKNLNCRKPVPFLAYFNLFFFPLLSSQETLIDFALTSTDIWALWHDAEDQTVVKYINFEQYGPLICHPYLPHAVLY